MLEIYNIMLKSSCADRFLWQIHFNFPFPALIYLVCALRHQPTGDGADKGWKLLAETGDNYDMGSLRKQRDNFLRYAMFNLIIKAWEAREAALGLYHSTSPVPGIISKARHQLAIRNGQLPTADSGSFLSTSADNELQGPTGQRYQTLDPCMAQAPQTYRSDPSEAPQGDSPDDWMFWNGVIQGNGGFPFDTMMFGGFYQT